MDEAVNDSIQTTRLRNGLIPFFFVVLFVLTISPGYAQECGPFCPVCSGTGSSLGALVAPGTFIPRFLFIPGGEEESFVFNVRTGLTSWLDAGLGYTAAAKKMIWSLRFQPLKEKESSWQPALILGTGSVQTGGNDQSMFLQASKSWEFAEGFAVRVSAGAASLLPELNEVYFLAGLTFTLFEDFSPFISYDGISFHPGIAWVATDWLSLAFILVESKEAAFSIGFRADLAGN